MQPRILGKAGARPLLAETDRWHGQAEDRRRRVWRDGVHPLRQTDFKSSNGVVSLETDLPPPRHLLHLHHLDNPPNRRQESAEGNGKETFK